MKSKCFIILGILIATLLGGLLIVNQQTSGKEIKLKSINLATDYEIEQVLEEIDLLQVNTVNVPIAIQFPSLTSNSLEILDYSENKAIELIKILNKKGINVILEPFPWINNGSDYETAYHPKDIEAFFTDWQNILNYLIDEIANKYHVYAFIVGSNFTLLEPYETKWCDLIDEVRSKYAGIITYKTSWWYTAKWDADSLEQYNKKLNNSLFEKVDMISIAAYFELSEKSENTVEELINCLTSTTVNKRGQNVVDEITNFYDLYQKPIYFAELGFPRRNHATTHPWNSYVTDVENDYEQARGFEAYQSVFENKDYFIGYSIFALGNNDSDKYFYPSDESIEIIKNWY